MFIIIIYYNNTDERFVALEKKGPIRPLRLKSSDQPRSSKEGSPRTGKVCLAASALLATRPLALQRHRVWSFTWLT
jgi:hypothetical protein